MPHAQTVRGPIDPGELGFTLPHEHTQIALWHIANRWDYWQLTRDEPVIARRARGVQAGRRRHARRPDARRRRPRPAVAAGAQRAERPPRRDGLWLVSRPRTTRRRRASTGGPSTTWPTELVREATEGVGETGIRPGIIGEIGTDKPWLTGQEERVHRAAARAATADRPGDHDPCRPVRRRPARSSASSRRRASTRRGSSSAMPIRIPHLDHYLAIVETRRERRVRLPRHDVLGPSSGCGEPRRRSAAGAARTRPRRARPAQPGRLPRQPARVATRATATRTSPRRSCRASARRGVSEAEIAHAHRRQPEAGS